MKKIFLLVALIILNSCGIDVSTPKSDGKIPFQNIETDPSLNPTMTQNEVASLTTLCQQLKDKIKLTGLISKRYDFAFEKKDCDESTFKKRSTLRLTVNDSEAIVFDGFDRNFESFFTTLETDVVGQLKGFCSQVNGPVLGEPVVKRHLEYTGLPAFLKSLYFVDSSNCPSSYRVECLRVDYSEAIDNSKYEVNKKIFLGFLKGEMPGFEAYRSEIRYTKCEDDSKKRALETKAILKEIKKQ